MLLHRVLPSVLSAILVATSAFAQHPADSASVPRFEDAACPFSAADIDVPDLRCGYLTVQESRGAPETRLLRLAVAISSPPNATADPVVLLPGGPGGSPLPQYIERFRDWVPSNRTVVLFDPRGTGYSPGLLCPELSAAYSDIAAQDLLASEATAMRRGAQLACRNKLIAEGMDLDAYNSTTVALDLKDLRVALGYASWNIVSASYGVPFARAAMRLDPAGIRSAVLGYGPSPDLSRLLTGDVPFFHRALQRVFRGCASAPECAAAFPRLEQEFLEAYASLRDHPLSIAVSAREFRDSTFAVNAQDFVEMIYWLLGSETQVPRIPALIHAFHARDGQVVERVVSRSYGGSSGISAGMGISVMCYDAHTPTSRSDWEAAAEGHPEALAAIPYFLDPCDFWGSARASTEERDPPASPIPAVVVQGEFDPMSPPQVGEEQLNSLPNGQLVVMPGAGHMFGGRSSGCWADVVSRFISNPARRVSAPCLGELAPLQMSQELPRWAQPRTSGR